MLGVGVPSAHEMPNARASESETRRVTDGPAYVDVPRHGTEWLHEARIAFASSAEPPWPAPNVTLRGTVIACDSQSVVVSCGGLYAHTARERCTGRTGECMYVHVAARTPRCNAS